MWIKLHRPLGRWFGISPCKMIFEFFVSWNEQKTSNIRNKSYGFISPL